MSHFYISTPLYYVNDKPHVGHAYTTIAADVASRWNRFCGKESFFLTGTDEHGQKVFRAAAARNIDTQAHVDELVTRFQELWTKLDIQYNDFIRTTEHATQRWSKPSCKSSMIRATFMRRIMRMVFHFCRKVLDGKRIWSMESVQTQVKPSNGLRSATTFFRMSNYTDQLKEWIETTPGLYFA